MEEYCLDEGYHRFFALELLVVEDSKKAIVPLICTQCGELRTHTIDVKKLLQA
jgi:hypothetical protein